jgi:NRAMP (natural resistance-associated macrophage protein)-like metal ion transporter
MAAIDEKTTDSPGDPSRRLWGLLGPGLITGAADDDPSGIGTYSIAGAQFGYGLLWLTPLCLPLMIVVQEMCGRLAEITGEGLAATIKRRYPQWVLWSVLALLFAANTINVWADLNVMAASAQMLFGSTLYIWLTAITAVTVGLQIAVPYRVYVRYLKWMCLTLLAYVVTALLPGVRVDWRAVVHNMTWPRLPMSDPLIMTIVGFVGTTISPYLFFWQAGETVEEEINTGLESEPGKRQTPVTDPELRRMRADTILGMVFSQGITFFIVVCAAATLNRWGLTNLDTAQDAAKALLPLGSAATWLFALGILGTGLLSIPTLAASVGYGVAEAARWKYGLYRDFRRAPGFYLTIIAVVLVAYLMNFAHGISPVKGLLYAAVINGLAAPPLIFLLIRICNSPAIVGTRTNPPWVNMLGWLTVILMSAAALFMFWTMLPAAPYG